MPPIQYSLCWCPSAAVQKTNCSLPRWKKKKKVFRCALYGRYNEAFCCSRKASCKRETVLMTKWHFNEPYGISHTYCISVSRTDLARFNTAGGWTLGNSVGSKSFTFLGTDLKHCFNQITAGSSWKPRGSAHLYLAECCLIESGVKSGF